jgi:hypothetical protein
VALASVATFHSSDFSALPHGACVLDSVPWQVVSPQGREPRQFVALRSKNLPELPDTVRVAVDSVAARRLHVLHAYHGKDSTGAPAGAYRLVHANGAVQQVDLRAGVDAPDWWMPFGHPFGGGGAHRLDADRCRLAFVAGPDAFQGHCLYHFWTAIEHTESPVVSIEVVAGADTGSLVVAGITLERTA